MLDGRIERFRVVEAMSAKRYLAGSGRLRQISFNSMGLLRFEEAS
jgi:hypothetical protein